MKTKLSEVCEFLSGNAWKASSFHDSGIPVIRINNMNFKENDFVYWQDQYDTKYLIKKGDLLLSLSGTIKTFRWNGPEALLNQRIVKITAKQNLGVNIDWVYYQLHYAIEVIASKGKQAVIRNLSINDLKDFEVDIPDISIQNKIVAILNKASSLEKKRKKSIDLLDKFLKGIFWNLFGDLGTNNYHWPIFPLVNLCKNKDDIRCGPFGTQLSKSEFLEIGIPLWGIKHVNSDFSIPTNEFVSTKKAKDLSNYILQPRDIVMTRKGTIGNCQVYPEHFQNGVMHSDILRIRVDETRVNPHFLTYQFKYNEVLQWQINRVSPGVVMSGINVSKLKKIEIVLPEKGLQDKFDVALKYVNNLKMRFQDRKLDELFLSIMQKVFNGQLNFNVDFELDSLIQEIDLQNKQNDLSKITGDIAYLQRLVDKLNNQEFKDKDLYDKAKHGVFQLITVKDEERKVIQKYDEDSKSLKLDLK